MYLSLPSDSTSKQLKLKSDREKVVTLRAPKHPAIEYGGLQAARYPGGTAGVEQGNTPLWNPDIRIPVVKYEVGLPRPRRKDTEAEEPCREYEEAEELCGQDDAEKMVQGDAVMGESRTKGPRKERNRLEQLTPGESLDEGLASPGPTTVRHVPGGAWLQQVQSCLQSRINALVGKEEGERGRKGLKEGEGRGEGIK
ncbi:hypothetical protein NDU88_003881 [Pleurodeles waltl]|uniref:Uncharacterized protein n=1 Tax=Pleurodeles waltl TaxID=8319 RepID=A0AAV7TPV0_PLEWA|nr:hypothetical protein NDU88_003881 [Pleurodeles waltl]